MGIFDEALKQITPLLDTKFGELKADIKKCNDNVDQLRKELKAAGLIK